MEPVALVTLVIVALIVVVLAVSLIAVALVLRSASGRLGAVVAVLDPSTETTETGQTAIDEINHDLERGCASLEDLLGDVRAPERAESGS